MLALLLVLHHAAASDTPHGNPIVKKIASCPDVGYFFKRESIPNAIESVCHLCFCQQDDTAVCWPRELRRCDAKSYQHYGRKKRFGRVRRSPGFSDVFFRDAAKDVFDKNTPEECEPFQSSYSEGCPPADWCIGCTVCDCNANGRWDCHVLSFCPDDKGKKKKKRGKIGKRQANRTLVTTTTKKLTSKTTQKPNIPPKKLFKHRVIRKQNQNITAKSQNKPNKAKMLKVIPVRKAKAPVYKKKPIPKSREQPKIIRKSKNPPALLNEHEDILKNITHTIFKKVMDSVEKIIRNNHKNITHALQQKIIQKRAMPTHYKNDKGRKNNKQNTNFKNMRKGPKGKQSNHNLKSNKARRSKREIPTKISYKYFFEGGNLINATRTNVTEKIFVNNTLDNNIYFVTPISKLLTKPDYFKYAIDFQMANSENLNETFIERILNHNIENNSSKVSSHSIGLTTNTLNGDVNKPNRNNFNTNPKVLTENNFTEEVRNISDSQIININKTNCNRSNTQHNVDGNFSLNNNVICGKICKFKQIYKKIVMRNTTIPIRKNIKKINMLKYFKRVFSNFFTKDVNVNQSKKESNRKRNLIKTICQNFDSCKIDIKNTKLSYKIDQLRAESKKIMQAVSSIKGLLKLVDIDKNIKELPIDINKQISNNDIAKLNAIIKDDNEIYNLDNLTETQIIQVSYIKQNTKIFMKSLEKFAQILTDIIKIVANSTAHGQNFTNYYNKDPKTQVVTSINKNNTMQEKLDKIKELLTNYNLVQNKFMKRMYTVIKSLGSLKNQTTNNIEVSNEITNNNNTLAIEIYTKNVIKNLRKLENLAQKLSSKNRKKRDAIDDDDVVQYLLLLMEYMLKQQKQLKISPANDGIDLLIEAIKSAPDIKATRKKVLDYFPVTMEIDTTEATSTQLNAANVTDELNKTMKSVVPKFKTFDKTVESVDEEEESNDFYQYNRKLAKKNHLKGSELKIEEMNKEDIVYPFTTSSSHINLVDDKIYTVLNTDQKDNDKRFEVFVDDNDDEDGTNLTLTKSPGNSILKESIMRTTPYSDARYEEMNFKDTNDTHSSQNNRIKLDWIEDSYTQEDERKDLLRFTESSTQKFSPTHTTLQIVTRTKKKMEQKTDKYDDPISSISSETEDEEKKRTKYMNSEYVMYKKQMNLLNSLDYGTEKIEVEGDSAEEKSNVEQFASYFV